RQQPSVERHVPQQQVGEQGPDQKERTDPAQNLVRQEGECYPAAPRVEELPQQSDSLVAAGANASPAAELATYVRGGFLASDGGGLVDDLAAGPQLGLQRDHKVVHDGRRG